MAKTVEILVYDGMNELDFSVVYDILTSIEVVVPGQHVPQKGFNVETVADRIQPIETSHRVKIFPHKGITMSMRPNILIVPGGPGARRPHVPQGVLDWLTNGIQSADVICSTSSGVYILGRAGLIMNRKVATHYTLIEDLHRLYPRANIIPGQRVVTDGKNLMTSAGGTAGIDLALALTLRFCGQQAMQSAANRIEYVIPAVQPAPSTE